MRPGEDRETRAHSWVGTSVISTLSPLNVASWTASSQSCAFCNAEPTSSHVIPGDKLDHDHASPGLQVQVPLTDRCGCRVVVPTRSSAPWTLPRYGPE